MVATSRFQAVFVGPPNPPRCFDVSAIQIEQRCGVRKLNSGDATEQRVGTITWSHGPPPQGDI